MIVRLTEEPECTSLSGIVGKLKPIQYKLRHSSEVKTHKEEDFCQCETGNRNTNDPT